MAAHSRATVARVRPRSTWPGHRPGDALRDLWEDGRREQRFDGRTQSPPPGGHGCRRGASTRHRVRRSCRRAVPPARGDDVTTPRWAPGRSALAAVVLSGLGPGAGHAYVGRPYRGAALVLAWIVTSVAWTMEVPRSYDAARLFALPPTLLLLALLADSGRLARRAPRPFALAGWQRWWTYAAIVAITGFAAPAALGRALSAAAAIHVAGDDALEPRVLPQDWVVVDRRVRPAALRHGDVIVVSRAGQPSRLRRIVGLAGDNVTIRRGVAEISGRVSERDLLNPWLGDDLTTSGSVVPGGHVFALSDRRRKDEIASAMVPVSEISGRGSWVLLPGDHDVLRMGQRP